MVLLDEEGKPVYPAIISTDERASSYCKNLERMEPKENFPLYITDNLGCTAGGSSAVVQRS